MNVVFLFSFIVSRFAVWHHRHNRLLAMCLLDEHRWKLWRHRLCGRRRRTPIIRQIKWASEPHERTTGMWQEHNIERNVPLIYFSSILSTTTTTDDGVATHAYRPKNKLRETTLNDGHNDKRRHTSHEQHKKKWNLLFRKTCERGRHRKKML